MPQRLSKEAPILQSYLRPEILALNNSGHNPHMPVSVIQHKRVHNVL